MPDMVIAQPWRCLRLTKAATTAYWGKPKPFCLAGGFRQRKPPRKFFLFLTKTATLKNIALSIESATPKLIDWYILTDFRLYRSRFWTSSNKKADKIEQLCQSIILGIVLSIIWTSFFKWRVSSPRVKFCLAVFVNSRPTEPARQKNRFRFSPTECNGGFRQP